MLRRWDDSQKYLSDNVHLVCEETANYLVIWCIDLVVEVVRADTAEWGVGRAQKALPFFFLLFFKFYFYHLFLHPLFYIRFLQFRFLFYSIFSFSYRS